MKKIGDILKTKTKLDKVRNAQSWQEEAVYMAKKLDIDLKDKVVLQQRITPQWFKIFKISYSNNQQGKLDKAYSYLSDHPSIKTMSSVHKMKLFFKMYYVKRQNT